MRNNNSQANPNKPSSDQLVSAGLGLRYFTGPFGLDAQWGRVMTGGTAVPGNLTVPQVGDAKFHVNLTARF